MLAKHVSSKICLIGDGGVGKTSLIGRYVYDFFDDKYLATIGTKVSRKVILLNYPDRDIQVKINAMIWDIMGQRAFRSLLHEAYFYGAKGIIGVCNLTDEETLASLNEWIESVKKVVGDIPMVLLANKSDLKDEIKVSESELKTTATSLNAHYLYTSAKTGENVINAFLTLGREIVNKYL